MTGDVEITLPKMPDPTPPTGFALSGYQVGFDGMKEEDSTVERTLQAAKLDLELKIGGRFKVYARCKGNTDETREEEMTCEWRSMTGVWGLWEYV